MGYYDARATSEGCCFDNCANQVWAAGKRSKWAVLTIAYEVRWRFLITNDLQHLSSALAEHHLVMAKAARCPCPPMGEAAVPTLADSVVGVSRIPSGEGL